MATRQNSPRTVWVWLITGAALVLIFYVVHMMTRGSLPIRVASATIGDLKSTLSTNGKVEPQVNDERHAPYAGVIRILNVHEGEKVPAGMLLLAMDDSEAKARVAQALTGLRAAEAEWQAAQKGGTQEERLSMNAQLDKAVIDRDQAQHDLDALQRLQTAGAASPSEVSAAKERLAVDNSSIQSLQERQKSRYDAADLAHAKAALEDAQAACAAAEDALNQAVVRSSFAGTVYSLPVSKTEFVQAGDRLLSMANLDKLQVRAYFDEPEIGKLRVGQPATIVWDARPTQTWHGHVARVPSTVIGFGTRNVGEALVAIDDADGQLLPDTNVRVTVTVANESNVLTVPRDALHVEGSAMFVYRLDGNTIHRTPVTIGSLNLTDVQIVSGLHAGDRVALGATAMNGQPLNDGEPVKIVQ